MRPFSSSSRTRSGGESLKACFRTCSPFLASTGIAVLQRFAEKSLESDRKWIGFEKIEKIIPRKSVLFRSA